jgi:hypothetical protein
MMKRQGDTLGLLQYSSRKFLSVIILIYVAPLLIVLTISVSPREAMALPLYARQTGQPCATCHTAFLELTPFGRRFKLGGYTLAQLGQ